MVQKEDDNVTIIQNEYAALRFYPKPKIVHHELRQFVHGDLFREILMRGLEIFEREGAAKWLSDDRGNGALTPADTDWALGEWAPRVLAAGWKYWAVVMPQKMVGQMNMKRWIKTYGGRGVTVRPFSGPIAALRWLEQQ